ncbi:MAG: hypothetical protein M5U28_16000 [Sandaracinaceae bacterium]|nr:hypothetical protein [Sandaracinaceae bacterium]
MKSATATPRSVEFRRQREKDWLELGDLVDRVLKGGLSTLDEDELERLPSLYRSAVASLAVARRTALDRALIAYLEALAARAYLAVYGTRKTRRGALLSSILEIFPRRVRALRWELCASFGITALGTIVSFVLVMADPAWYFAFVDPALAGGRDPSASTEDLRAVLYDTQGPPGPERLRVLPLRAQRGDRHQRLRARLRGGRADRVPALPERPHARRLPRALRLARPRGAAPRLAAPARHPGDRRGDPLRRGGPRARAGHGAPGRPHGAPLARGRRAAGLARRDGLGHALRVRGRDRGRLPAGRDRRRSALRARGLQRALAGGWLLLGGRSEERR